MNPIFSVPVIRRRRADRAAGRAVTPLWRMVAGEIGHGLRGVVARLRGRA